MRRQLSLSFPEISRAQTTSKIKKTISEEIEFRNNYVPEGKSKKRSSEKGDFGQIVCFDRISR